jgi:hypothetical protein
MLTLLHTRKQVVTGHPLVDGVSSEQGHVYSDSQVLPTIEPDPNNPRWNFY